MLVDSLRLLRLAPVLLGSLFAGSESVTAAEPIRFNRDIRPILSDTCWHCHGPGTRKAELRLDRFDDAVKETENGVKPIVPGKPDASEAIRRIFAQDAGELMPPPDSHKTLTAEQKDLLRRWVAEGAKYEKHWSFETPVDPPVPAPPKTGPHAKTYRVNNPIDAFLIERLAHEKLPMQPEADRPTLLRRVAFALTGLPPTIAEQDLYFNDKTPDAYEKMVDRYLASEKFGEEMARPWLDVARYGDTHGLHLDNERQMWLYRDWVVRAYNENKPFDVFTIEQLAGDLLPNPTHEQQIATGFSRCNVSTSEGGSIADEWVFRNAVDRTSTMAETWLGLTAGCAVCHDHKFDPLSAKEFYSLYAFFLAADVSAMDGNNKQHAPVVKLSSPEQDKKLKELATALDKVTKQLKEKADSVPYNDPAANLADGDTEDGDEAADGAEAKKASPKKVEPKSTKVIKKVSADDALSAADAKLKQKKSAAKEDDEAGDSPKVEKAVLEAATDPLRSYQAWIKTNGGKEAAKLPPDLKRTLQFLYENDKVRQVKETDRKRLRDFYVQNVCSDTKPQFEPLIKKQAELTKQKTDLEAAIPGTFVMKDMPKPKEAFVMLRGAYDKPGDKVEPGVPAVFPQLKLKDAKARPSRLDLARWLVAPEHPLTARVTVNRLWQQFFGVGLVKSSFDFGAQGDPPSHPELLDWLAVRFAKGTKETGNRRQGTAKPSASELSPVSRPLSPVQPWDVKQLIKLMLTSAAFRQSSAIPAAVLKADPENRLYARGPRFRLDGEQLRDNALYVSGLIDLTMGGRGVNPYQPPNIWEPVAYTGSNTRFYKQDTGSALYRRSLYTFFKRTAPPPFMSNFDAPNREQFCSKRERSNTPLQALQLMNDVQHFEAARAFAERILTTGGRTPEERITFAYRTVLSRKPDAEELHIVGEMLEQYEKRYREDETAAKEVVEIGESKPNDKLRPAEVAAYTLVANMILNLDETITRN